MYYYSVLSRRLSSHFAEGVDPFGKKRGLIKVEKWNGYVNDIDVAKEVFTAKVKDRSDRTGNVTLKLKDVSEWDKRQLMRKGAMFTMTVGYYIKKNGKKTPHLNIRFWRPFNFRAAKRKIQDQRHLGEKPTPRRHKLAEVG
ncbi:MAG TPA: hypothetical protein VIU12_34355 [Chryseolinea sp.]